MTRIRLQQLSVAAFVAVATSCAKSFDEPAPTASAGDEASPQEIQRTGLDEGQLLAVLASVDTGEIKQAQVALAKAASSQVRNFASDMIEQHTRAKQSGAAFATQNGLAQRSSPASQKLERDGGEVLDSLQRTDIREFDQVYVQTQLNQHAAVLDMLDTQLIPSAPTARIKQHLTAARTMVQQHLTHAQQLRDSVSADQQRPPSAIAE